MVERGLGITMLFFLTGLLVSALVGWKHKGDFVDLDDFVDYLITKMKQEGAEKSDHGNESYMCRRW